MYAPPMCCREGAAAFARVSGPGGVSEAEKVRNLHEKLAAVVGGQAAGAQKISAGVEAEGRIEILQVAVIAHVDDRTGVEQVGNQKIEVEVLGGLQRRQPGVRERSGVLGDEAHGELAIDLVIPFRADDVVGEDARGRTARAQAREQVAVVQGEPRDGAQRHAAVRQRAI